MGFSRGWSYFSTPSLFRSHCKSWTSTGSAKGGAALLKPDEVNLPCSLYFWLWPVTLGIYRQIFGHQHSLCACSYRVKGFASSCPSKDHLSPPLLLLPLILSGLLPSKPTPTTNPPVHRLPATHHHLAQEAVSACAPTLLPNHQQKLRDTRNLCPTNLTRALSPTILVTRPQVSARLVPQSRKARNLESATK